MLANSLISKPYYTPNTQLSLYINSILCNIIHIIRHSLDRYRYNCYTGVWGGERETDTVSLTENVTTHNTQDSKTSLYNNNLTALNTQGLKKHLYINELTAHSTRDLKSYITGG